MGSGEKERSKTSLSEKHDDYELEYESEDGKNESYTMKDGGSSSNSTVDEEGENKKPSVRPYVRSKMPRLRWTPDLHLRFVNAVKRLGGQDRATPKLVLQLMNIKGLNIAHVKSHLQMCRSKKIDDPNQGLMNDHRFFMEGVDRNVFNLSQLPLLPSIYQRSNSSLRYGDAAWINDHGRWTHNPSTGQNISNKSARPGFYGTTLTERSSSILGNHYSRSENHDLIRSRINSSLNEGSTNWITNKDFNEKYGSLHQAQSRQNPIEPNSFKLIQQRVLHGPIRVSSDIINLDDTSINRQVMSHQRDQLTGFKRKASEYSELDLNLSLGIESRNEDIDEHLALSLTTVPLSSKVITKKLREDVINVGTENNARGASTLDLTL